MALINNLPSVNGLPDITGHGQGFTDPESEQPQSDIGQQVLVGLLVGMATAAGTALVTFRRRIEAPGARFIEFAWFG